MRGILLQQGPHLVAESDISVEGPHGVPSSQTILGVRMTVETLTRIKVQNRSHKARLFSEIDAKTLVTLIIEHFNSKMRSTC